MFHSYPFSSLTGFSKLLLDFFGSQENFFAHRFPSNSLLLNSESFVERRAKNFKQRKQFIELIHNSCKEISFSKEQAINFNSLGNENTLVVVAGQQPGFLGGPLFILYKSISAINLCFKLKEIYPNFNFVPVFWVEDNDHDSYEASQIYSFNINANNEVVRLFSSSECKKTDRTTISEKTFNEEIKDVVNHFLTIINNFEPNPEFKNFIVETYKMGEEWSSSFIKVLNYLLCENGILFIRSSVARKMGLFTPIITKEIDNLGQSNRLIESANSIIESHGYHIQAKTSAVNLFFHIGKERHKVLWDSKRNLYQIGSEFLNYDELVALVKNEPTNFSPNVLLRPICQDWITPNIASVVGPSELGYSAQLKELYEWFELDIPAIIPRHSLTILPTFMLENQNLLQDLTFYLQPMSNIESILFQKLRNKEIKELIDKSYLRIQNVFTEMKEVATSLDKSLEKSVDSHCRKAMKVMENFERKLISAEKRKLFEQIEPHRKINSFVYPNGSLQERIITLLFPFSITTRKKFFEKIGEVFSQPNNFHYLVLV